MHRTSTLALKASLIATAFAATLSLLALRDRLDQPARLIVEPTPAPLLVVAGR